MKELKRSLQLLIGEQTNKFGQLTPKSIMK